MRPVEGHEVRRQAARDGNAEATVERLKWALRSPRPSAPSLSPHDFRERRPQRLPELSRLPRLVVAQRFRNRAAAALEHLDASRG